MRFAGLDLGATFLKAAVLDIESGTLSEIRRHPFPPFLEGRPAGVREVDAVAIANAARGLIEETVRLAPDCAGVWLSGQMHGFVLCDDQGRARSPFISWQDQRCLWPHEGGGTHFDAVRAALSPAEVVALGNELRPGLPLTTLGALHQRGELPEGYYVTALSDFVLAHLGATAPVTSPTHAAAHGLFDVAAAEWHRPVLARLGLDRLAWPRVATALEPWGELRVHGKALPFFPTFGDQQVALLGAGLEPGELSVNVATGSQVSLIAESAEAGDYQVRPFFDGAFLRTITHLPAGRALNALIGLLTELADTPPVDPWTKIAEAVAATESTDVKADISFFPCATGSAGGLQNLREENLHLGPIFRAAFESMATNYTAAARRLSPAGAWNRVVFSGSLSRRIAPLREAILADLEISCRIPFEEEDALMGLLVLARAGEARKPVAEAARDLRKMGCL